MDQKWCLEVESRLGSMETSIKDLPAKIVEQMVNSPLIPVCEKDTIKTKVKIQWWLISGLVISVLGVAFFIIQSGLTRQ